VAKSNRKAQAAAELKNISYEIFIGVLSVLSIVNLVLVYAFRSEESLQQILSVMNALFSAIFLGDFIFRMRTAPSAGRYFFRGFGWADLLASLPFPQLKILRIFRLIRVIRLMREVGPRTLWNTFIHDRANSALMTLLLLGVLVLQFGSLSILYVEEDAEGANITSASDALWYTIVTISTVGYGDQFPVTNAGRILGTVIIVVGVGIFGTFTGYLANLFLGPGKSADPATAEATDSAPDGTESTVTATSGAQASGPVAPPVTSDHTAKGLAAGGAAGAVKAGAATGAGTEPAPASPAESGSTGPQAAPTSDRLAALLDQSERLSAELRELVAAGPASGGPTVG
jgi:hypothetical protein